MTQNSKFFKIVNLYYRKRIRIFFLINKNKYQILLHLNTKLITQKMIYHLQIFINYLKFGFQHIYNVKVALIISIHDAMIYFFFLSLFDFIQSKINRYFHF